jgi:hypothetical protein
VLLTDLAPENLRAAYAAMKWLRERAGSVVFDCWWQARRFRSS